MRCIIAYHRRCSFSEVLQALQIQRGLRIPVLGGAQIIAFCGLIETTGFFQASSTTDGRGPREGQFSMKDSTESAEPGNYGVGFPNFLGKVEDPEARKTKLAAELANGRLAMMVPCQRSALARDESSAQDLPKCDSCLPDELCCLFTLARACCRQVIGCLDQAIIGMFFQDGLTGSAWGDWVQCSERVCSCTQVQT